MRQSKLNRPRGVVVALAAITALAASALCGGRAAAQSGRRARETRTVETPQPAPIITPKIATETPRRRNLPYVHLAVAGRIGSRVTRARAEAIYNNFAMHLGESMQVTSIGLAKRDEAVKRARGAGWQYVAFVELEFEPYRDGRVVVSSPDIVVNFSVVDALSGETKTKGAIYYRPDGGEGPVKRTPEAAGEEAAERVLDWFALPGKGAR